MDFDGVDDLIYKNDLGWNDYGYYTLHELWDRKNNKKLGCVHFFNEDQNKLDHANPYVGNHVCFIKNEDTAKNLRESYSNEELDRIKIAYNISFDADKYKAKQVFLLSVLRNINLKNFKILQEKIKGILSENLKEE